jgi:HSP20 family protein
MGQLSVWSPFRELDRIARRWDPSFSRSFDDMEEVGNDALTPAIESYMKDENLVVRADMPGLDPKDVDVTILGNVLTVKGERKNEKEVKKDDYLRREVSYGSFERRMSLPEGAATDKAAATFKNGVVEITLPMAKEAVVKKIPVQPEVEKKVEVTKK